MRLQLALNVKNLDAATEFYSKLFNSQGGFAGDRQ